MYYIFKYLFRNIFIAFIFDIDRKSEVFFYINYININALSKSYKNIK